jgi:glycosyltransferase involved in cell wall biosynthesis
MLTHSYYEEDPRVRREAEALVRSGRPVEVFSLRREGDPADGELEGVRLHRLDVQRHQGAGLGRYLAEYLSFFARAGFAATRAHRRSRYALVEVHTLPDFLVFAAMHFRLAGIPLVLNLHEAMPEFFRLRFPRASTPLVQKALAFQERAAISLADAVLTVNDALGQRLVSLGVPARKVTVVRNTPDLERFAAGRFGRRPFMADGTLRFVYAGALTPTYEVDVAIEGIARFSLTHPTVPVELDAYGRGDAMDAWIARAAHLNLADRVRFPGRIPIEAVPAAIAAADIGLAPTRRTAFTDYSLSTKIFEYAAMGKPVIASRLPLVEEAFGADSIVTYEAGDARSFAEGIGRLVADPLEREARVARAAARVREMSWAQESRTYLGLIEGLIAARRTGGGSLRPPADDRADRADAADMADGTADGTGPEPDPAGPNAAADTDPTADPAPSVEARLAAYAGRS